MNEPVLEDLGCNTASLNLELVSFWRMEMGKILVLFLCHFLDVLMYLADVLMLDALLLPVLKP